MLGDDIEKRIQQQRNNIKEINSKLMGLEKKDTEEEFRIMDTKEEVLTVIIVIITVIFLYFILSI